MNTTPTQEKVPQVQEAQETQAPEVQAPAPPAPEALVPAAPSGEQKGGLHPAPRILIDAFAETEEGAGYLQALAKDRHLQRAKVNIHMGGITAAQNNYASAPSASLLILETKLSKEEMFAELEKLSALCTQGTRVILISWNNDVSAYRHAIEGGIDDYLVAPLNPSLLIESVCRLFTSPDVESIGRSVSFYAARGGAGASTLAHNIGWILAEQGGAVSGIMDLDIAFGTAALDLNYEGGGASVAALDAKERLDRVLLDRLFEPITERLTILAADLSLNDGLELLPEDALRLVEMAKTSMALSIIDLPHQWSGWCRDVLIASDDVVLVTTPDLAGLRNVRALMEFLKLHRANDRPPFIILNQTGANGRPEMSVRDFSATLEHHPDLVLSFEAKLFGTAANSGQMLAQLYPKDKTTQSLYEFAKNFWDFSQHEKHHASQNKWTSWFKKKS